MKFNGHLDQEESFNAFFAGLILSTEYVSYSDFNKLISFFQNQYNTDIVTDEIDITIPLNIDDNGIRLRSNIDDIIFVDGKSITIRSYLYSFITPRVKAFFNIPDITSENKTNSFCKKLIKNCFKNKTFF